MDPGFKVLSRAAGGEDARGLARLGSVLTSGSADDLAGSPATLVAQTSDPVAADPGVAEALEVAGIWLEAQRDYDEVPGVSSTWTTRWRCRRL